MRLSYKVFSLPWGEAGRGRSKCRCVWRQAYSKLLSCMWPRTYRPIWTYQVNNCRTADLLHASTRVMLKPCCWASGASSPAWGAHHSLLPRCGTGKSCIARKLTKSSVAHSRQIGPCRKPLPAVSPEHAALRRRVADASGHRVHRQPAQQEPWVNRQPAQQFRLRPRAELMHAQHPFTEERRC